LGVVCTDQARRAGRGDGKYHAIKAVLRIAGVFQRGRVGLGVYVPCRTPCVGFGGDGKNRCTKVNLNSTSLQIVCCWRSEERAQVLLGNQGVTAAGCGEYGVTNDTQKNLPTGLARCEVERADAQGLNQFAHGALI